MEHVYPKTKGQISIIPVAITAIATIMASVLGGWSSANQRVSSIDTKVEVVEERENNHYAELEKRLDKMDDKLDLLIKNSK